MHDIGYYMTKLKARIFGGGEEAVNRFFRKHGVKIGEKCLIYSNILTSDSYLIDIGNNVCISIDVKFVTHDFSVKKVLPDKANLFGKIICAIIGTFITSFGVALMLRTYIPPASYEIFVKEIATRHTF